MQWSLLADQFKSYFTNQHLLAGRQGGRDYRAKKLLFLMSLIKCLHDICVMVEYTCNIMHTYKRTAAITVPELVQVMQRRKVDADPWEAKSHYKVLMSTAKST